MLPVRHRRVGSSFATATAAVAGFCWRRHWLGQLDQRFDARAACYLTVAVATGPVAVAAIATFAALTAATVAASVMTAAFCCLRRLSAARFATAVVAVAVRNYGARRRSWPSWPCDLPRPEALRLALSSVRWRGGLVYGFEPPVSHPTRRLNKPTATGGGRSSRGGDGAAASKPERAAMGVMPFDQCFRASSFAFARLL